ncbi:MAG: ABC transporter substrate-binding protein [Magnetococcales bacterium]|nr:ABC transporter substrate-binding protein [Magnetococcales bacterium]
MKHTLYRWTIVVAGMVGLLLADTLEAGHALTLDQTPKYAKGFQHFDYFSPQARVGGTLALGGLGSFDKFNPYTFKGIAPDLLATLSVETLTAASHDEPFARYGLLAEEMVVATDGLSVTYTLHPQARFSDGSAVTAADVAFSFDTLRSEQANPFYRTYWRDIQRAEVLDKQRIRFHFAHKSRELPLIAGEIPVLSQAFFKERDFRNASLVPLGSGPYGVESYDLGKTIRYKRRSDYWGWQLPTRRGQYNFEQIVVKYFKDPVVMLEAFKAGEFDFMAVNNSKEWARDYQGDKFSSGQVVKESLPHRNSAGMQGFLFNIRRPLLQDIRVRQAITLAFDFEWSNQNLFYGQYTRSSSYFSNSEMAATAAPSPEELTLLEKWRPHLSEAVFQPPVVPPSTSQSASPRQNQRQAAQLLQQAGWKMGADGVLVDAKGARLELEAMLVQPAFERIMAPFAANLKKVGILLNYRTVDESLYQRRLDQFDYDMVVHTFAQSQSPGSEQRDFWHSSSATVAGSQNLIGIQDPVVDFLVERIAYADNRHELITACRALDRVLLAGHYLVPNFHIPYHRIAYWNRFDRPAQPPLYYSPNEWLMGWWLKGG